MLGAGLKKQSAVAVSFSSPVFTQYSFSGGAVLSYYCIKVTKNDELAYSGNSRDNTFSLHRTCLLSHPCLVMVIAQALMVANFFP